MKKKDILGIVVVPFVLLLIPLVAMQFTDEVNWDLADFVVAWILLAGAGFIYKLVTRGIKNKKHKVFVGAAVAIALALVWVHLAVGLIE